MYINNTAPHPWKMVRGEVDKREVGERLPISSEKDWKR
jgi:hypothetical protein